MEAETKTLKDFKEILSRRKWSLIVPIIILFLIALIVAFAITPTYRSTATILIEEQEIPKEYVMSTRATPSGHQSKNYEFFETS